MMLVIPLIYICNWTR